MKKLAKNEMKKVMGGKPVRSYCAPGPCTGTGQGLGSPCTVLVAVPPNPPGLVQGTCDAWDCCIPN